VEVPEDLLPPEARRPMRQGAKHQVDLQLLELESCGQAGVDGPVALHGHSPPVGLEGQVGLSLQQALFETPLPGQLAAANVALL
jgi:hypothetical protein